MSVFVSDENDIYVNYDEDDNPNRIDKWTSSEAKRSTEMCIGNNCAGLFIDNNDYLYCSSLYAHRVLKKNVNCAGCRLEVVAGTGAAGNTPNQLNHPQGIFVDADFTLYVADSQNHRIQQFTKGEPIGMTVSGNAGLQLPIAVVLDSDKNLYVVDRDNHRVIRIQSNISQCIAGCSDEGELAHQLKSPWGISFDPHGNLFVADTNNKRIQKFILATNSCGETSTTAAPSPNASQPSTSQNQSTGIATSIQPTVTVTPSYVEDLCPTTTTTATPSTTTTTISLALTTEELLASTLSSTPSSLLEAMCRTGELCENHADCQSNAATRHGYDCRCVPGFTGVRCQLDHRPCKAERCWNYGQCHEVGNSSFRCACRDGWTGGQCQTKEDYCRNVTCQNNGVCRSLFRSYRCECLGHSYFGDLCQTTAWQTVVHQTVSKSFGYVAIIAMSTVVTFVIVMDALKYGLGIDPVEGERERGRQERQAKRRRPPVIEQFVYVHKSPTPESTSQQIIDAGQTVV